METEDNDDGPQFASTAEKKRPAPSEESRAQVLLFSAALVDRRTMSLAYNARA
jgi:hypothetical protein